MTTDPSVPPARIDDVCRRSNPPFNFDPLPWHFKQFLFRIGSIWLTHIGSPALGVDWVVAGVRSAASPNEAMPTTTAAAKMPAWYPRRPRTTPRKSVRQARPTAD